MLLSSQTFERIVGMNEEPGRQATVLPAGCRRREANRRQVPRVAFGQRSQICRDHGKNAGMWETVMVQDISTMGIGFICHDPIELGRTFMLKLTDKQGEPVRIRCKVQRCERGGFGNTAYLVGSTFEQVIEKQVLRVNDDEDIQSRWQEQAPTGATPVTADDPSTIKTAGGAMASAAVNFLKAVNPLRAASNWMRKADDFS